MTGAKIVTAPVWKHLVKGGARTAGGSAHEKDMEAFYKFQKDGACCVGGWKLVWVWCCMYILDVPLTQPNPTHTNHPHTPTHQTGYDNFRENFLHARSDLIYSMPVKKQGGMVWIDVGGGTARNLEFLPVGMIIMWFGCVLKYKRAIERIHAHTPTLITPQPSINTPPLNPEQVDVIRKYFKAIFVVDVSPSLLEVSSAHIHTTSVLFLFFW